MASTGEGILEEAITARPHTRTSPPRTHLQALLVDQLLSVAGLLRECLQQLKQAVGHLLVRALPQQVDDVLRVLELTNDLVVLAEHAGHAAQAQRVQVGGALTQEPPVQGIEEARRLSEGGYQGVTCPRPASKQGNTATRQHEPP